MSLAKGRIAPRREIVSIRPITREDLPRILKPRDKTGTTPQRLRDSHHQVARLIATGIELTQVAALSGYSMNRVSQLAQSPAMLELVAHYRVSIDANWYEHTDLYNELLLKNKMAAERHIADEIEERESQGERLSIREALAVARDAADRTGHGKKQTNVNVNVDYAAALERAIARSGKQIEGQEVTHPARRAGASTPQPPGAPATLRRLGHAA